MIISIIPILLFFIFSVECFSPHRNYTGFGVVNFRHSCDPKLDKTIQTAVGAYFSFFYDLSEEMFDQVIANDTDCCIAVWGKAVTNLHPIWAYPSNDVISKVSTLAKSAAACVDRLMKKPKNHTNANNRTVLPQNQAFITGLNGFAKSVANNASWSGNIERMDNQLKAYSDALFRLNPRDKDANAEIVHALALLSRGYVDFNEPHSNATMAPYPHLRESGGRLLKLFQAEQIIHNPGVLHLIIHSFDQPFLAEIALPAAKLYLDAAPGIPHALHMPSHIFIDLGFWKEAVLANILSMNTAYKLSEGICTHDFDHASYFYQFAMLQSGLDCEAKHFIDMLPLLPISDKPLNGSTTIAVDGKVRSVIMYIIETRDWHYGAVFDVFEWWNSTSIDWTADEYAWTRVTFGFVKTLSLIHLNANQSAIDDAVAQVMKANHTMQQSQAWQSQTIPYWALSIELMVRSTQAWSLFSKNTTDGIEAMREVLKMQNSRWQPEVGHTMDAHEQLASMLTLAPTDDHDSVINEQCELYESALSMWPNRYNTLYGLFECSKALSEVDDKYRVNALSAATKIAENFDSKNRCNITGLSIDAIAALLPSGPPACGGFQACQEPSKRKGFHSVLQYLGLVDAPTSSQQAQTTSSIQSGTGKTTAKTPHAKDNSSTCADDDSWCQWMQYSVYGLLLGLLIGIIIACAIRSFMARRNQSSGYTLLLDDAAI